MACDRCMSSAPPVERWIPQHAGALIVSPRSNSNRRAVIRCNPGRFIFVVFPLGLNWNIRWVQADMWNSRLFSRQPSHSQRRISCLVMKPVVTLFVHSFIWTDHKMFLYTVFFLMHKQSSCLDISWLGESQPLYVWTIQPIPGVYRRLWTLPNTHTEQIPASGVHTSVSEVT